MRLATLLLCLTASLAAVDSVNPADPLRTVTVYGAHPTEVAFSAAERRSVVVGEITVQVSDYYAQMLEATGNTMLAEIRPVWAMRGEFHIDDEGRITADPEQWHHTGYQVVNAQIVVIDSDGQRKVYKVPVVPESELYPEVTLRAGLSLGQVYWYEAGQCHVIEVQNGTQFQNASAASAFVREELRSSFGHMRATGVLAAGVVSAAGTSFQATPSWSRATADIAGAIFAVVDLEGNGYVFRERKCLINGDLPKDPFLLDDVVVYADGAVVVNGWLAWSYTRNGMTQERAESQITEAQPISSLPAQHQTVVNNLLNVEEHYVPLQTEAESVTAVGGQDTNVLVDAMESSLAGMGQAESLSPQGELATVKASINASGVMTLRNGSLSLTTDPDAPAQLIAGSDDLTKVQDEIAARYQQEHQLVRASTPVIEESEAPAEGGNIIEAVRQVEEELYPQTPTSLPLRGGAVPRYAVMHPAGWWPEYEQGNPVPGDGNNPERPLPSGVQTGVPSYDLDGDGDLDRIWSTDPYGSGYTKIHLKWKQTHHDFRMSDANPFKNTFAVYALGEDVEPTMLFCGYDGIYYSHRQGGWRDGGKVYHCFALRSHLDPQGDGTYRFAIRYTGNMQIFGEREDTLTVERNTVSWQETETVVVNGQETEVKVLEATETVSLYVQLGGGDQLIDATYSEEGFVPRATDGQPLVPAIYVRTETPYTIVPGTATSIPGTPVSRTIVFPDDFNPEDIEPESHPPYPNPGRSFMWDYPNGGGGMPRNYHDGDRFPRGVPIGLNHPQTIQTYGGTLPLMSAGELAASGGIDFRVKESTGARPVREALETDEEWATRLETWRTGQSMWHKGDWPWVEETELIPGDPGFNHVDDRIYDIVEGAGWYFHKGERHTYVSSAQQMNLLYQKWSYDMWEPRTVFTYLYIDNDPAKGLLRDAEVEVKRDADALWNPTRGVNAVQTERGATDMSANAVRRKQLRERFVFVFSGARGREREIEMARYMPKNTDFYCVEYDDAGAVQAALPGRHIQFISDDKEERAFLGSLITKIWGKTAIRAGLTNDGKSLEAHVYDQEAADLANATPGTYVFQERDIIYGKPCYYLESCALLEDGQYAPRDDQWYAHMKMEFRHPMALFYDDRHSALTVAYGHNADPRLWVPGWDDRVPADWLPGEEMERVQFEAWEAERDTRLAEIYDGLHPEAFELASPGNIEIPEQPAYVAKPIRPEAPQGWQGGSLEEPSMQNHPGEQPTEPQPPIKPWAIFDDLAALEDEVAAEQWMAKGQRVDASRPGYSIAYHGRRLYYSWGWNDDDDDDGPVLPHWLDAFPYAGIYKIADNDWWKWSLRQKSNYGTGGEFKSGQGGSYHFNMIEAATFNAGPSYRTRFRFENDDGGGLAVNDQLVHSNRMMSTSTSSGQATITIASGITVLSGTQREGSGYSAWRFKLDGRLYQDYVDHRNTTIYPIYRQGPGNAAAREARDRYFRLYEQWESDHLTWETELVPAWEAALAAHERATRAHDAWEARMRAYAAWEEAHQQAIRDYEGAVVAYEEQVGRRGQYETAMSAWTTAYADLIALREQWDDYVAYRDDWVYLANTRLEEDGTMWGLDEPAGEAFVYWRDVMGSPQPVAEPLP